MAEKPEKKELDPETFKETVECTMSEEDFSPEAIYRRFREKETAFDDTVEIKQIVDTGSETRIDRPGLTNSPEADNSQQSRYKILQLLGSGASGKVFSARDTSLDRQVAIKLLHEKLGINEKRVNRFIREARITASLEHPNILPVYDLDNTPDGDVYLTMREAQGRSLGEIIEESVDAGRQNQIETVNDCITIILKVCDALAYAHDKGVIHQDIKPDNILIGNFGEVLVVDWGTASSSSRRDDSGRLRLVGTPAYMSPEQARKEGADRRSDLYCTATTLFHLLFLRHPIWADTPEEFWKKKREGTLDALKESEKEKIGPRLTAILKKALNPDPEKRYQDIHEFSQDLRNFQQGQAVSVFRDSFADLIRRWYRNNRKVVNISAVFLLIIAALGSFMAYRVSMEYSDWQTVTLKGDLDTEPAKWLENNWGLYARPGWLETVEMDFESSSKEIKSVSGALIFETSKYGGVYDLYLTIPMTGDMAMEWDCTPLFNSSNLNCFIGGEHRLTSYTFHINTFGEDNYCLMTKGHGTYTTMLDSVVAGIDFSKGTTYRFRMEKEGNRIRLMVNETVLFDYLDIDPLFGPGHQSLGFDTCNNSLRIENIQVFHKPLPQKISPLAVPNALAESGNTKEALLRYRELIRAYPGTDIEVRSRFKTAMLSKSNMSKITVMDELTEISQEYPDHPLIPEILRARIILLLELGEFEEVEKLFAELHSSYPNSGTVKTAIVDLQNHIREVIRGYDVKPDDIEFRSKTVVSLLEMSRDWNELTGFNVEVRTMSGDAAGFLNSIGRHEDVLRYFPGEKGRCRQALLLMGKEDEADEKYPETELNTVKKLIEDGKYEEILKSHKKYESKLRDYLLQEQMYETFLKLYPGRDREVEYNKLARERKYEEVLKQFPGSKFWVWRALMGLDRYEEVVENVPPDGTIGWWIREKALLMLGREAEVLEQGHFQAYTYPFAYCLTGFRLIKEGRGGKAGEWFDEFDNQPVFYGSYPVNEHYMVCRFFLPLLLKSEKPDIEQVREKLSHYRKTYKNRFAGFMEASVNYITGESDVNPAENIPSFFNALRADLNGEKGKAGELYQKSIDEFDPGTRKLYSDIILYIVGNPEK